MAEAHSQQNDNGAEDELEIPILTDVITPEPAPGSPLLDQQALAQLRSTLTAETIQLASRLMHGALREMEAALLEQMLDRMRQQLPELLDKVLADQLAGLLPHGEDPGQED